MKKLEEYSILSIFFGKDMARSNDHNVTEIDIRANISKLESLVIHLFLIMGWGKQIFSFLLRKIDLKNFSIIVVNEMAYAEYMVKYVREQNPDCKIIYWLWNTLSLGSYISHYDKYKHFDILKKMQKEYNFKIISFDKVDCKRYNITNVNQITIQYPVHKEKIDTDIFFIGKDKGRLKKIKELSKIFNSYGLVFTYWIFPWHQSKYTKSEREMLYHGAESISYREVVNQDYKSKALLDLVQENQNGLTWRPIEAIFYKKKLITNYSDITHYNFYRKENIFILDVDDMKQLSSFINTPYVDIPDRIVEQYTYLGALTKVLNEFNN